MVELLDCTLRDGGYINDWEFGSNNLLSIYERLLDSGVEIVEVGFLDDRRPFDMNRSIMPNTECVKRIWGCIGKKPKMLVGMIDYGTCSIENIQPCDKSDLDGIRVIFKKHIMREAMEYCSLLKKLGYLVFAQLVSITSYSDDDLMRVIELVNEVHPYAVSIVDTYGLLYQDQLLHYYELLDRYVEKDIKIGFHAHNNLQLAYANVISFIERETQRDIIVDGTLYGMGKSAGNAPIELIAKYLNQRRGRQYQIESMLEAIQESILDYYKKTPWGYQMVYYLSATNECHPSYVQQIGQSKDFSLTMMNHILQRIEPEEKKLLYTKEVAESLCKSYQECIDDEAYAQRLRSELQGKKILLIGPGKTISLQSNIIQQYVKCNKPVVITVNYLPESLKADYVYITNSRRYLEMTEALYREENRQISTIATTNVNCKNGQFSFLFAREPLLEKSEMIPDNSFLMLLKILHRIGIKKVVCAGFDGYSDKDDNYLNPQMEYSFIKDYARHLNEHMRDLIRSGNLGIEVEFLTYSHYTDQDDCYRGTF